MIHSDDRVLVGAQTGKDYCALHLIPLESERNGPTWDDWCPACRGVKEIKKAVAEKHGVVRLHPLDAAAILSVLNRQ